jgi:serine phosphatase RsbU (regulator of sigma subunit)
MGMVKSAARMALRRPIQLSEWLGELNAVLFPLKAPNMFVTMAAVAGDAADRVTFAVAGHLPIVVVRAEGAIEEHTTPQVPIGIFEERTFDAEPMAVHAGDVIALLTDGLVEVFDRQDEELGLEPLEALLRDQRAKPLASMAEALIVRSRAHGAVLDDQTVLLMRRVA